jgi:hypothetical protein
MHKLMELSMEHSNLVYELQKLGNTSLELLKSLSIPTEEIDSLLKLSFTDLGKLASNGSGKPLVTPTGYNDKPKSLIVYKSLIKLLNSNQHIVANIPCGVGKSTSLRDQLITRLLFDYSDWKNALVLKERVTDALEDEIRTNLEKFKLIIKSTESDTTYPSELREAANALLSAISNLQNLSWSSEVLKDFNRNNIEQYNELLNQIGPHLWDDNQTLPEVLTSFSQSTFSYNKSICINPNYKNTCKSCTYTTCRANPSNREKHQKATVLIATHAGFYYSKRRLLEVNSNPKESRSLVIFDEKPKVFSEYSVKITDGDATEYQCHRILSALEADTNVKTIIKKIRDKLYQRLKDAKKSCEEDTKNLNSDYKSFLSLTKGKIISLNDYNLLESAFNNILPNSSDDSEGYFDRLSGNEFLTLKNEFSSLKILTEEELIAKFTKYKKGPTFQYSLHSGVNEWGKYRLSASKVLILDGTPKFDVDYRLPGSFQIEESDFALTFPNLTFHCYSKKEKGKSKWNDSYVVETLKGVVGQSNNKILVIRPKNIKDKNDKEYDDEISEIGQEATNEFNRLLGPFDNKVVQFNWYGNLKGRNEYRDSNVIFLTHVFRLNEIHYLVRAR